MFQDIPFRAVPIDEIENELHALAQAGIGEINIGVESGLDDVLSFMNKGFTLSNAKQQLSRLQKANMPFSMNIIGGSAVAERIHSISKQHNSSPLHNCADGEFYLFSSCGAL